MKCIITFTFTIVVIVNFVQCIKLDEVYAWQELNYAWPSESVKQEAIASNRYIEKNNLPFGLERWNDKLFITVPRGKVGVASSLNYVKITDKNRSPILHPYPSWELNTLPANLSEHTLADNATIISTYRIRADECDRLWVMDTGVVDVLGNPKQVAPNALVIFDLKTDRLIRRFNFPESHVKEDSSFVDVIVDANSNNCGNSFAYVPDIDGFAVIVYSFRENRSWRVKHNFFHFDPLNCEFDIAGVKFQWADGIFGMALDKTKSDGSRDVYFHALSSTKEFVVSNRVLQNETYSQSTDAYYEFKLVGDRGPNGQSSVEVLDTNVGVLFYTQVNKDAIGCWNTRKPYIVDTQGLVDSDSNALVFPNDLKVDNEGFLWVLSDRMPAFMYQNLNPNEFNYRILRKSVADAIRDTPCV